MPAPHGRVDDAERKQRHRGIVAAKRVPRRAAFESGCERFALLVDEWPNGLLDDQRDKRLRGVIRARPVPRLIVRARPHRSAFFGFDTVFENRFIDRPELLNRKIAVVDVAETSILLSV